MCFKLTVLALTCVGCLSAQPVEFKSKRQAGGDPAGSTTPKPAGSGYGNPLEDIHAGSKYFQDIYVAQEKPNEVQFGHVAENPDKWEQRFEKINLDSLQRQGKVRWGDKNGAYGEHYYDFNHDGKNQPEDGAQKTKNKARFSTQQKQQSVSVPAYVPFEGNTQRGKREQGLLKDVEFINDRAKSLILDGNGQKHGGNYKSADDYRGKREHVVNEEDLVFESDKGTFLDRRTGIEYELQPLYS